MKILSPNEYYNRISTDVPYRPSYWHQSSSEPLLPLTIGQLIDWAAERWESREALVSVYENVRLTFAEARDKADELAAGLLTLGLKSGDRLAVWSFNSTAMYLTSLAAARIGVILTKIDPNNQGSELLHCLKKVGAKAIVVVEKGSNKKYYDILHDLVPELSACQPGLLSSEKLPNLKFVVFQSEENYPGIYSYESLFEISSPGIVDNIRNSQNNIQSDDGVSIHFTSGTTGTSKGVLLSHHSLVNNAYYVMASLKHNEKGHRFLTQIQLCHIGANLISFLGGLFAGATTVIPGPKYSPMESVKACKRERCTGIMGTPAMYVDLIDYLDKNHINLNGLEYAHILGAPATDQLIEKMMKHLPVQEVLNGYGMTECGSVFGSKYMNSGSNTMITVSRIKAHYEVKVVDPEGNMVPMGTPGELWVRSYGLMRGYYNDEEKTKEAITPDGWLKTGDRVELTSNGDIKIVGRIKDAIIRGGDKIFPKEIEEFFQSHPDIIDAQAFGVPDPRWGEEMCVCIRMKENTSITEHDIREYCKEKIAEFRIPRYIRFVSDYPRNTTGKIDKKKLQETFRKDPEIDKVLKEIITTDVFVKH